MGGSTESGRSGCFDVLSSCFKPGRTRSSSGDMPNARPAHIQDPKIESGKPEVSFAVTNVRNPATSTALHSSLGPTSSAEIKVSSEINHQFSSHNQQTPDLWGEAFEGLNDEYKKLISTSLPSLGDNPAEQLISLVQKREESLRAGEAKIKIGDREILWRDCATRVVSLLSTTVSIGIQFAPAPGALVWSALKVLLEAHAGGCKTLTAIFGCADKVLSLMERGAIYEHVFLQASGSPDDDGHFLRKALINAYTKSLELLCYASRQLKDGAAVRRFLGALWDPEMTEEKLKDLQDAEDSLGRLVSAYEVEKRYIQNEENGQLLQRLNKPLRYTEQAVTKMLTTLGHQDLSEMLDFICDINVGHQHEVISSKKSKGTGDWLLKCKEFREWEGSSSSKILWLTGKVGAGKSVLTSDIVDRCRVNPDGSDEINSNVDEGFAFFYYSKNNKEVTQDPVTNVLRSFLRQLAQVPRSANGIFDDLVKLYRSMKKFQLTFSESLCQQKISSLINILPRTTLILDSLDEMEPHHMQEIVSFFVKLLDTSTRPVKIFVSSRTTTDIHNEVYKAYNRTLQVDIGERNTRDIELFVRERTTKLDCPWRDDEVRSKVVEEIAKRANGMFRWAFLQLDQLVKCNSTEDVENRLGQLPIGLTAAYDELYTKHGFHDQIYLNRAIKWVMHAKTPFNTKQLLSAVQLWLGNDTEEPVLGTRGPGLTERALENICLHLIVKDHNGIWAFPHASVQEYFVQKHTELSSNDARIEVAKMSLLLLVETYQCPKDIESLVLEQASLENSEDNSSPISDTVPVDTLEQYISQRWMLHVQDIQGVPNGNKQISKLLKRFIISQHDPSRSTLEYQRWCEYIFSLRPAWYDSRYPFASIGLKPVEYPAFGIATLGITVEDKEWARACLEHTTKDLNYLKLDTLSLAAENGHAELCVSLIEMGSDPNRRLPSKTSPLILAIQKKRMPVVKVLLEHGADPNLETDKSPLCEAIQYRSTEILQLLLTHGALTTRMCSTECTYGCALEAAADYDDQDAAEILIEAGATVDFRLDTAYITPLVAAASWGSLKVVKILIKNNADVGIAEDVKDSSTYGGVMGAAFSGQGGIEMLSYLITEAGASPNRIIEDLRGKITGLSDSFDQKSIRETSKWLFANKYLDPWEVQDLKIGSTQAFIPLVEIAKCFVKGELS